MLMGTRFYGPSVDMWSLGCIFAELWMTRPLFTTQPGATDLQMLEVIFGTLGSPTEEDWPAHSALANFIKFDKAPAQPWQDIIPQADPMALKLLGSLLQLNPNKRITAEEALNHPYFATEPPPTPIEKLPKL
eukprot:TRINITY_DN28226_c0_g1_i3.p1 TRINITY_DN28226_c0_g1~~TRINITY_DN28226_c0_g1_i3.p1  ORF type:complete len:132 (-),score=19.21 TRINITY_DN28226_c0_g1_i3:78-473(-)